MNEVERFNNQILNLLPTYPSLLPHSRDVIDLSTKRGLFFISPLTIPAVLGKSGMEDWSLTPQFLSGRGIEDLVTSNKKSRYNYVHTFFVSGVEFCFEFRNFFKFKPDLFLYKGPDYYTDRKIVLDNIGLDQELEEDVDVVGRINNFLLNRCVNFVLENLFS